MTDDERFNAALAAFDQANAEDPRRVSTEGEERGYELLYAQRMSARLQIFCPDASQALQLAARAQHICRWRIPRSDYPVGRSGYKKWRTTLMLMHADLAREILGGVGYEPELCERVADLIMKKRLRTDAEVQTLEDVICLVFLEHYFADFAAKHPDEKVIDIVRKTWGKMSDLGHEAALALPLADEELKLVQAALLGEGA